MSVSPTSRVASARRIVGDAPVAVVGAGLVGLGWAVVFARSGLQVRLYDIDPAVIDSSLAALSNQLAKLAAHGLLEESVEAVRGRITVAATLRDAVTGSAYVQESVLERVEVKRALIEALESIDGDFVVGSSTSGIPASAFASDRAIARRVLIVHPVNPPSLVPLVELVPSPLTSAASLAFATDLMAAVGQTTILVHKEVQGFVLNRLQAVLLREAWALVEDGIASCEDVDRTVRDGLGWRWSFMGPFETIDLNAPGGIADYARRLGPLYQEIAASRKHSSPWDETLIADVEAQRRATLPFEDLLARREWRDDVLMDFAKHRLTTRRAGSK